MRNVCFAFVCMFLMAFLHYKMFLNLMDQRSIIVVGAAHSLGDNSMVKLLEEKGCMK